MIEKILIPIDGSNNSKIALEYGVYMANRLDAKVTGLHVIDIHVMQEPIFTDISGSLGLPPSPAFVPIVRSGLDARAKDILGSFKSRCEEAGLRAETAAVEGIIDETIIAEGKKADMIVLTRKGEHFHLSGGKLSSTVEAVVRKSGKPVMVTPEAFCEIESMGLAYDGSLPAENALKLAVALSEFLSWPITIIVIANDHSVAANIASRLEDFLEPFKVDTETVIIKGKEDREIVKFIQEGSIELMVMGAYGHNRLREFLVGSTTSYVIRKSAMPVLLAC